MNLPDTEKSFDSESIKENENSFDCELNLEKENALDNVKKKINIFF